jgi:hypothetical protein
LYDTHRTCLVRCSSYYQTGAEANVLPDTQSNETTTVAPKQDHADEVRSVSSSRRAAAIEAAYILEAVRK